MGPAADDTPPPGRAAPYVGLSPFGEDDASRFFGRSAEVDLVVANLLTSRVTVLYGASGAGKSSLLRAGVLPRLHAGDGLPAGGSRRAVVLVDAWQRDPAQAILAAVSAATGDATPDLPLDEALAGHARRTGGILLLILDQFEDYFLYHGGEDDVLRSELPLVLARPDSRARVLISMREDTLAALDGFTSPTAPLFANLLRLGPMSDEAALEAITRPLDGGVMRLEAGVAERVLELLHGREPGAGSGWGLRADGVEPAYLQLVMRRLWEREVDRGSSVLRTATLASMGGLRDIVSQHLGEALDRLSARQQQTMAHAFHYLVTPSGAKIAQRREDLAQLTGVPESEIAAPLAALAAPDARILRPVADTASYEIFHDVLAQPLLDWQSRFHTRRLQRRAAVLGMLAAAAAAIVVALAAYALDTDSLEAAELISVDARFAIRGDVPVEPDLAIVDLDDPSLAALGGGADRIPRRLHARMIDELRAGGATVIAYDFEFLRPTRADVALRQAIARAGPQLVLGTTKIDGDGEGQVFGRPGTPLAASVAYAGLPASSDGAYRQVDESVGLSGSSRSEPLSRRLQSLAVVAAHLAGDPPAPFESAWIDYHGESGTIPSYAFADVLRDAGERFRDKVVVVGTSARRQADLHPTAHGGRRVMSGAEIQANAISTLRRDRPLRPVPTAGDLAVIVALGLLPALLAIAFRPTVATALLVVAVCAYLAVAQALFGAGRILPVVYPLFALVLSAVAVLAARWAAARRHGEA